MAVTELLKLTIDANVGGAVSGIERVGNTATRQLSRAEKSIDRFGSRLTSIGAGMVGLGSVALVGLGAAAMASEEANLATVKLENTLANMPQLAGENSEQFIELADAIQDKTAADGDQIVAAEAMLGTFRLTADEIKKITPLVVDYARKFDVDLVSAATQVGKALDGNVGALKRNGVSIDEVMFKTDRYGAVMQALRDQVGGFAEAEGKTFAGSLERMKNELEDLAEGIGTGAVDGFSSLFGIVQGVTDRLNEMSPATQGVIGKIGVLGSVGLIAGGGLSFLIGQVIKARQNFADAATAVHALYTRLGGLSGVVGGLSILGPLAVGAGIALQAYSDTKAEATRITDRFARALAEEAEGVKGATDAALSAELTAGDLGSKLREAGADLDVFTTGIQSSGDAIEELDNNIGLIGTLGLAETLERAGLAGSELGDELLRVTENMSTGEIIDLVDRLDGLSDRYGDAAEEAKNTKFAEAELTAQHGEEAGAVGELADGYEEAKTRLEEYREQLQAQFDPVFGMISAENNLRDAKVEASEAQAALNDALAGGDPTAIAEAQRNYDDALTNSSEALVGTQSAQAALNDAVEANPAMLAQAKDALYRWAISAGYSAEQASYMAGQLGNATTKAQELDRQNVNVPIAATDRATPTIRSVEGALARMPSSKDVSIRVHATGLAAINLIENKLLGFATGGTVPGPRGKPRLVVAHGGETVVPTHDQAAMRQFAPAGLPAAGIGGGGGGTTVVYNVSMAGAIVGSEAEAARWVSKALRAAGESGRPITVRGRRVA